MGNSCTSSKGPSRKFKTGRLFVHSKTQKIAYKGDSYGISPVTTDILQMSTQAGITSTKEPYEQNQIWLEAQAGNLTPVSGQAYKNYIKIQINNIPVQQKSLFGQSKFSQQPNSSSTHEDEPQQRALSSPSPFSSKNSQEETKKSNEASIKQKMQEYFIDSWDCNMDLLCNKTRKSKKSENILKDFTKRERGLWRGPTQNSLFDAMYLAFTLNEDLVLNPHDIWDQILITLKQFYQRNNIRQSELFPNSKRLSKESKVINYRETPNQHNKRELISWDQILKQISEHNQEILQTLTNQQVNQQDAALSNNFKIKRISQLVYNQLIYLDNSNSFASESATSNLPYQIFPGHSYEIRNIVFRSSLSDWFLLREKILSLIEVAPEFWIERLYFIIDNFVDTLQGKLNHQFWNQGFLMKSSEYPASDLWKFGWIKELFNIDYDNNELFEGGLAYTCIDIQNQSLSRPFVFRIPEHKIDISMNIQTHKSCIIQAKNLPNSFEPLLTMYLTTSMKEQS